MIVDAYSCWRSCCTLLTYSVIIVESMAPPKNKGGNKKSKGAGDEDGGSSSKVKPAQSINVRHILVRMPPGHNSLFVTWSR